MPDTQSVVAEIRARNPMHYRFVVQAIGRLSSEEAERVEGYLAFCRANGRDHEYLAASYLTVVSDTLREQAFFRKHGRYRYSTFAEVASAVYFDDEYMSKYMYGLAISSFLWPNHLEILRFFNQTLPTKKRGRYLEIGPGHGYFLMTAMKSSSFDEFLAVDISDTSIQQTRALIEHFTPELGAKADLRLMDFLDCDLAESAFNAVVMGEVLEHVEAPLAFLRRIRQVATDNAHIYVTTCINAPAVDHISLFQSPEELAALFFDAGLSITDALIQPYEGKTIAESLDDRLPVNVAYVLAKA
jgi:2-polyprenyl-3-methyl-5-hydroxy-6-metoxy-1,4-benzoquinol methylase